ncbi:MAG: ASPIC/UnbV domain-containing protein, partial [Verrucomicrobiales bacterium]
DGNLDITVVGNLYSREPETGLWRGSMGLVLNGNGKGDFAEMPYGYSGFVVPGDGKSLTRTDLNGDGVPDLVAGQNNDRLLAFQNDASSKAYVSVRLQGKAGNSSAIGSKLTLHLQDGSKATAVVDGGSGYLSQSSAEVFFGLGLKKPKELTIRWPDGNESLHDVKTAGQLRLAHP